MKRFAATIIFLYGAILMVLTQPVLLTCFTSMFEAQNWMETVKVFNSLRYWVLFAIMLLCQAALLGIPVRMNSARPVTQRPVVFLALASSLLAAILVWGIVAALYEYTGRKLDMFVGTFFLMDLDEMKNVFSQERAIWLWIAGFAAIWTFWGIVFYRQGRKLEPKTFVERQCKFLLAGSALELLVAVPTHIIARGRDYCCAGFSTFVGIAAGISIMLISFGPGVFFLYADRWKKLRPGRGK